jgi:hypothetical protein
MHAPRCLRGEAGWPTEHGATQAMIDRLASASSPVLGKSSRCHVLPLTAGGGECPVPMTDPELRRRLDSIPRERGRRIPVELRTQVARRGGGDCASEADRTLVSTGSVQPSASALTPRSGWPRSMSSAARPRATTAKPSARIADTVGANRILTALPEAQTRIHPSARLEATNCDLCFNGRKPLGVTSLRTPCENGTASGVVRVG